MNALPPPARPLPAAPLSVADYIAFCATRPRGEDYELIDGELRMMIRPVPTHQLIASALTAELNARFLEADVALCAATETAVRIKGPPDSVLVPDVAVFDHPGPEDAILDHLYLAAEIPSPGNSRAEIEGKRLRYQRLPMLEAVLIIAPDQTHIECYARDNGFERMRLTDPAARIALPALGVSIGVASLYALTKLGPRRRNRHPRSQGD